MLIGYSVFGMGDATVFDSRVGHVKYEKMEITKGSIDQLYIDEEINIDYTSEKFDGWRYNTVINAKFNETLEAGSVTAGGFQIEKVRFQKRAWNELEWQDVAELDYIAERNIYYEAIDKNVAHDFLYQYSLLPITSTIYGNRIVSNNVLAEFDGIFISDIENNYKLMYDIDISSIQSNISTNVFEPLNSKFPIIVHSNLDYSTFDIESTFVSVETEKSHGGVNIRMERLGKDNLMTFMKNGRPKVYRDHLGNTKIVSVVGKPKETPNKQIDGIATLAFSLVEIGDFDGETLKANNLLEGLTEVF